MFSGAVLFLQRPAEEVRLFGGGVRAERLVDEIMLSHSGSMKGSEGVAHFVLTIRDLRRCQGARKLMQQRKEINAAMTSEPVRQ